MSLTNVARRDREDSMNRAPTLVFAVVVCALAITVDAAAQTAAAEGWVVLPLDEYRALRDRGLALPPPTGRIDATLTRVDYDLRVENDSASGRVLLTIDLMREGWARVPIPAGLLVRDARLDGQPVALVKGAQTEVLLSRAGRNVLALDVIVPVTSSAGSESLALPGSAAPIARAAVSLPKSGVDLAAAGGFVAERVEAADSTRWTSFGRANQPLILSWKRRVDDHRAEQPLRTRARITTIAGLGEDVSQVAAAVRLDVVQGVAPDVVIDVPAGLAVNQVDGATIADWQVDGSALRVRFLDPVTTDVSFVVHAEVRTARDGAIAVPLLRVPSAERETGGVAVDVAGAGEVAGRQQRGLDPADPSELGEPVTGRESPSMIAYRLRPQPGSEPRSLTVTVVRYTPQTVLIANVEEARYRVLASEDGALLVEGRYAVRNNQRSFLKLTMPTGATVWSATVSGRPIRPGLAEQGAILLPLEKSRAGEEAPAAVVQLVYFQRIDPWLEAGNARLDLPALDLPVSRTGLEFRHSPRFRVEPPSGSFHPADDPGPVASILRQPGPGQSPAAPAAAPASRQLQVLVDRFRNESSRSVAGALPVAITFPDFGSPLFAAAELTAEGRVPIVELAYKRIRR
jgi:hypothetical protein